MSDPGPFFIGFDDALTTFQADVRVVGVGGAGGHAVAHMLRAGLGGVDFAVLNSDVAALGRSPALERLAVGVTLTRGLGTGADPDLGRRAAEADLDGIERLVSGADLVFVAAGLGGGLGTGAAPVVAETARRHGALVVGVVTRPFAFEGRRRAQLAERGIADLDAACDALVVVANDRLASGDDEETLAHAFAQSDEVLLGAVAGISDLLGSARLVNLDFADVRSVLVGAGRVALGVGQASGASAGRDAAELALAHARLGDGALDGARGALINVVGGPELRMRDVNAAVNALGATLDIDANVQFGAGIEPDLGDSVRVTLVASGGAPTERAVPGPDTTSRTVQPLGPPRRREAPRVLEVAPHFAEALAGRAQRVASGAVTTRVRGSAQSR